MAGNDVCKHNIAGRLGHIQSHTQSHEAVSMYPLIKLLGKGEWISIYLSNPTYLHQDQPIPFIHEP